MSLDELRPIDEHRRLREQMLAQAAPRRDDPETWRLMRLTEQDTRDQRAAEVAERDLCDSRWPWAELFRAQAADIGEVHYP
jgi:hypothetical protein